MVIIVIFLMIGVVILFSGILEGTNESETQ
jgi:hypothetical protein